MRRLIERLLMVFLGIAGGAGIGIGMWKLLEFLGADPDGAGALGVVTAVITSIGMVVAAIEGSMEAGTRCYKPPVLRPVEGEG